MKDEKQQSFYFRSGSTFTADLDFVKMKNEDIGLWNIQRISHQMVFRHLLRWDSWKGHSHLFLFSCYSTRVTPSVNQERMLNSNLSHYKYILWVNRIAIWKNKIMFMNYNIVNNRIFFHIDDILILFQVIHLTLVSWLYYSMLV